MRSPHAPSQPERSTHAWSDAVYFHPFVGTDYYGGLVDDKRVLVLGESHYASKGGSKEVRDLTQEYFEGYQDLEIEPANRFGGKLQRILARKRQPERAEASAAWRSVAYANFVQKIVGDGARQRPNPDQWRSGDAALVEIVERLRPHVVLVLGRGTWNNIRTGKYSDEPPIKAPGPERSIWLIPHSDGFAKSAWIYHPSTGYDSVDTGISVFAELLRRA